MKKISKEKQRIIVVFSLVLLFYFYGIYTLYNIVIKDEYALVVSSQSQSRIELATSRGNIYDCNLNPLVNLEDDILAVAVPSVNAYSDVIEFVEIDAETFLSSSTPISFYADYVIDSDYIDYFSVYDRYTEYSIAENLIGYTDNSGNGITGIESAFNDILSSSGGSLIYNYDVNALGNIILGGDNYYENTLDEVTAGIVLTIDSEIQKYAEELSLLLKKGSILVINTQNDEIKAIVSVPSYEQDSVYEYLDDENSPLINRSFSAYTPGSVFKLLVSISALEYGYDDRLTYDCTGEIEVDGVCISCYGGTAHGEVNMHTALVNSCNCYFINLALEIGAEEIYETAEDFGFGSITEFYENYNSSAGNLPELSSLMYDGNLANVAIGQGDLLATPIQIASMINTIASDGIYNELKIYLGEMLTDGTVIYEEYEDGIRITEQWIAEDIQKYMESTADYGTAKNGNTEEYLVGAKTGTAQTGVYENGEELLNYWYAGYVGKFTFAEYVIVVLEEGAVSGENNTAEVFKLMTEFLLND